MTAGGGIRVVVTREYAVTVEDLFPDEITDGVLPVPRAYSEWPEDWDVERRAAFLFNHRAANNPFAESSFVRDFEDRCARSTIRATATRMPS